MGMRQPILQHMLFQGWPEEWNGDKVIVPLCILKVIESTTKRILGIQLWWDLHFTDYLNTIKDKKKFFNQAAADFQSRGKVWGKDTIAADSENKWQ